MEGITFYTNWEVALQQALQGLIDNPVGTKIASMITMLGEEAVMIVILGFLYWCYDKEFGKYIGRMIVCGLTWNPMLKNVVLRRRPYFDHENIKILKPVNSKADIYDIAEQGYSFPSGHSTNSAIAYGGMPAYKKGNKVLLVIGIVMPLLVGISRVMLGAHYVTDVLCGWAMGAAIIFLLSFLQKKIENENILDMIIVAVTLPGIFFCKTTDYFTGLGLMIGFFLSIPFEKKFVNFQPTKSIVRIVLRLAGGFAIYFGVNTLLKMPFSKEFLDSAQIGAYLVRTLRYGIIAFLMLGVYPMAFDKIGVKKE